MKKKTKEILQEILLYVTYNKNAIYLNQQIKVDICNKLGIAYQTMTNALTELKKSQILLYIDTGLYVVNPFYYGKGEWNELKKIRSKINVSTTLKNNVEIYNFEYHELTKQFFDKSKLKNAKVKKKKCSSAIENGKVKIKNKNSVLSKNIKRAYKIKSWLKKAEILLWFFK